MPSTIMVEGIYSKRKITDTYYGFFPLLLFPIAAIFRSLPLACHQQGLKNYNHHVHPN